MAEMTYRAAGMEDVETLAELRYDMQLDMEHDAAIWNTMRR